MHAIYTTHLSEFTCEHSKSKEKNKTKEKEQNDLENREVIEAAERKRDCKQVETSNNDSTWSWMKTWLGIWSTLLSFICSVFKVSKLNKYLSLAHDGRYLRALTNRKPPFSIIHNLHLIHIKCWHNSRISIRN